MEIKALQKGATLWLENGSVVEVIAPSADGTTVRVRCIESPFDEALAGTESDCTDYDIISYTDRADHADSGALG